MWVLTTVRESRKTYHYYYYYDYCYSYYYYYYICYHMCHTPSVVNF